MKRRFEEGLKEFSQLSKFSKLCPPNKEVIFLKYFKEIFFKPYNRSEFSGYLCDCETNSSTAELKV